MWGSELNQTAMVQPCRNACKSSHDLIYSVNHVHLTETQTEMTRQFLIKFPSIELHEDLFQGSAVAIYKQKGTWIETECEHTQKKINNVRINVALRCIHETVVPMEEQ